MRHQDVIAIDASRLAVDHLTGTETYTLELIRALAEIHPPETFELYVNAGSPPANLPLLGEPVCIPFPRLWTHLRLARELIRRKPRLLFVPAHVVPLIHPRTVVTIHDLGYLHVPETHSAKSTQMLDWTTRWSARAARHIIAISQVTKDDLVRHYGVPPSKITVIHHGISDRFRPANQVEIERVCAKHGLKSPYVLAVGTVHPRKNYVRLATAMAQQSKQLQGIELVIAGKRGWLAESIAREVTEMGAPVRWLGYVPDGDLPGLYSAALAVCQPSLYEGFGMPVIEAMACGTAVVAAATSALPEICGQAALFVDPLDSDAIGEALVTIVNDSKQRSTLIELGFGRAASFTWRRCAEATLGVLRGAIE